MLFDAELLPWSAKADELLRHQYAAVGAVANAALPAAVAALEAASARGVDVDELLTRTAAIRNNAHAFTELPALRLAHRHDHDWHLALADRLVRAASALIRSTRRTVVDTNDPDLINAGVRWWEDLTAAGGGEGMVVKPFGNLVKATRGYAPPGVKVRGREYLRIIYGPDYTEPAILERLRDRNLGPKRSSSSRSTRACDGRPRGWVKGCLRCRPRSPDLQKRSGREFVPGRDGH